jgi:hypothetical protein
MRVRRWLGKLKKKQFGSDFGSFNSDVYYKITKVGALKNKNKIAPLFSVRYRQSLIH